jgi:hypothetical protein
MDEVVFVEARAIGQMTAGTLYRYTSKEIVPGMVRRHPQDEAHTTELRFRTYESCVGLERARDGRRKPKLSADLPPDLLAEATR